MPDQSFDTIGSVLENPDMAAAFKEHLKTEFSVENIEFHKVMKQFAKDASNASVTDKQLKAKAAKIYDKYVKPGSAQQVNLPSGSVNAITDALKGASTSRGQLTEAMGGAQKEIVNLMNRDSFPRFQRSAPFNAAKEEANTKLDQEVQALEQSLEQLQARERQLKLNPSMGDKAKAMVTSGGMAAMIRDVGRERESLEQEIEERTQKQVVVEKVAIQPAPPKVKAPLEEESAPRELEEGVVGRGRSNARDDLPKPELHKPSVREKMGDKDASKVGQQKSLGVSGSDDASKASVKDKIKFFEQGGGGGTPPKRGVK